MPWIKVQTTLIDDPAVSAIASKLRMNEQSVVGSLVAIWSWADNLTADGFVAHATASFVDRKAGKRGFAEAMAAVGWLVIEPNGVRFPKWDRHNGQSAKARAGEAESKRLNRSGQKRAASQDNMSSQQTPDQSGQMSGQKPDNVQTREEKRREENINTDHTHTREEPPSSGQAVKPGAEATLGTPANESTPTIEEVKTYAAMPTQAIPEDVAVDFFHRNEAVGWRDQNGHDIRNWRSALVAFHRAFNRAEARRSTKPHGAPGFTYTPAEKIDIYAPRPKRKF